MPPMPLDSQAESVSATAQTPTAQNFLIVIVALLNKFGKQQIHNDAASVLNGALDFRPLNPAEQKQNNQDDKKNAQDSAREISPASAVGPGWQYAHQDQNKNNQ